VLYIQDMLGRGAHPQCLRFYLISAGYRKRLDFTLERFGSRVCACEHAGEVLKALSRIRSRRGDGSAGRKLAKRLIRGFESAMDDDLDTGRAFGTVFAGIAEAEALIGMGTLSGNDAREILRAVKRIDSVLCVFF
jgi:cysteinyl-tRNA synthetase